MSAKNNAVFIQRHKIPRNWRKTYFKTPAFSADVRGLCANEILFFYAIPCLFFRSDVGVCSELAVRQGARFVLYECKQARSVV